MWGFPVPRSSPQYFGRVVRWGTARIRMEWGNSMHTGAQAALPAGTPWETSTGTTFEDLGARADAVLAQIEAAAEAGLHGTMRVAMLAAQVGQLCTELRNLAGAELPVRELVAFGACLERGRRRSVRLV